MKIEFGNPAPKQLEAMKATSRYVAYGGARGGGKSWTVREKARLMALANPGIRQLIVRRTFPELEANHIRELTKMVQGLGRYNEQKKLFTFINGSIIKFDYCATDKDLMHYQGQEYDVIYIDEATNFTERQLREISVCCRGANDFVKRIYYTCNPGGPGHSYIKRLFIDRRYEEGENPDNYAFIQALVTDNRALMEANPEYIAVLDALPEKQRRAWRYGEWDVYEGQFFDDFRDLPDHYKDGIGTHVIDPFDPPANWTYYRSYDYGRSKPFSVGWWAMDFDGTLYRILELYGCTREPNEGVRWTADEQFAEVARLEREHPYLRGRKIQGVADPAIWTKDGAGFSIAEYAAKRGVHFQPGVNDRLNGWEQCHYRLQFDENGKPRMYVFSTCEAFRRTIPTLMYDSVKVEDLDTEGEDHVADEWRYMCMMRPIAPLAPKAKEIRFVDPLNRKTGFVRGRD